MTREQAKDFLIKLGIESPQDEQITTFLNNSHSEIESEKAKFEKYKADAEKLAEVQAELEKLKNEGMSEQEKILADLKNAQMKAEEREKEFVLRTNRLEIEKMLVSGGLNEEDYKDFIDSIVTDDIEKSKTLASALVGTFSKRVESAIAEKEKEWLENTSRPSGNAGVGGVKLSQQEEIAKNLVGNSENEKSSEEIIKAYS